MSTAAPGVAVGEKSVLVIARSATGSRVSLSVAASLPGTVSVTPDGTDTMAVLTRVPSAEAATVASTVNVAVPPASRSTDAADVARAGGRAGRSGRRGTRPRGTDQFGGQRVGDRGTRNVGRAVVGDHDRVLDRLPRSRRAGTIALGDRPDQRAARSSWCRSRCCWPVSDRSTRRASTRSPCWSACRQASTGEPGR